MMKRAFFSLLSLFLLGLSAQAGTVNGKIDAARSGFSNKVRDLAGG